jgi:leader peptidase (prepilin peptidase) / N-methyltransferase
VTAVWVVLGGALGFVVGWAMDPVIVRVPRRQPVIGPVPEDEPLVAAGGQRATVAVICAALFGAMAAKFEGSAALPAYLLLTAALVALSAIDLEHFILPNRIVYPLTVATAALFGIAAVVDDNGARFQRGLLAGVVVLGVFFLLHMISPRSMGFGDVKLSFVLGLALGWLSWGNVLVGFFLAFAYGAVVGSALLLTRARRRKQAVPFGPFLAAGTLTAILVGSDIISWYRG